MSTCITLTLYLEHPDDDGYSTSTLSSETASKKDNPYYKQIQKDYETLLQKSKRMEATIQSLELEKKSIQLDKDMELADVRSKNAALQKTIARQEKQLKTNTWQKRLEQLELDYEKKLSEKEQQVIVLQQDLGNKATELETTRQAHEQQLKQISDQLREATKRMNRLEQETERMSSQIVDYERICAENDAQIHVQQEEIQSLQARIQENGLVIQDLTTRLEAKEKEVDTQHHEIEQQGALIQSLQTQFKIYRQHMSQVLKDQRETKCQGHYRELNRLLSELHEAKKFINQQAIHLDNLKSDIYWLNSRCNKAEQSVKDMYQDTLDQYKFYQLFYHNKLLVMKHENKTTQQQQQQQQQQRIARKPIKKEMERPVSNCSSQSTFSFSSKSTVSIQEAEHLQIKVNPHLGAVSH
ncbi:unnamed protein product [Rhizopus microsporus]